MNAHNNLITTLLNILYPPRCMSCAELLPYGAKNWLCKICAHELKNIADKQMNRCQTCGRPVTEPVKNCVYCKNMAHQPMKNNSVFSYNEITSKMIYAFKYEGKSQYGEPISAYMKNYAKINNILNGIDCIIAVPLHKKREENRGYNQAAILAAALSEYFHIPFHNDVVKRIKNTKEQSKLNPRERMENISNAFMVIDSKAIENKNVMIIDDVYTTGATVGEISKILIENGAANTCSYTFTVVDTI